MFITFEGIDGCGKSTQASLLCERIEGKGGRVFLTREPGGGGEVGEKIRSAIFLEEMKNSSSLAELFLFCAGRAHHVERVIKPRLSSGEAVISDRYFDSTVVYQGWGRGIDLSFASLAAERSTLGVFPDLTFFIDAPRAVCMERLAKRDRGEKSANRMDRETEIFYKRLRDGFVSRAKREPNRIIRIDASGEIERTHGLVSAVFEERFGF